MVHTYQSSQLFKGRLHRGTCPSAVNQGRSCLRDMHTASMRTRADLKSWQRRWTRAKFWEQRQAIQKEELATRFQNEWSDQSPTVPIASTSRSHSGCRPATSSGLGHAWQKAYRARSASSISLKFWPAWPLSSEATLSSSDPDELSGDLHSHNDILRRKLSVWVGPSPEVEKRVGRGGGGRGTPAVAAVLPTCRAVVTPVFLHSRKRLANKSRNGPTFADDSAYILAVHK